jgi:hypothetical protein
VEQSESDPWFENWMLSIKALEMSRDRIKELGVPDEVVQIYGRAILLMTKEAGKAVATEI